MSETQVRRMVMDSRGKYKRSTMEISVHMRVNHLLQHALFDCHLT